MNFLQSYTSKRNGKFLSVALVASLVFFAGYLLKPESKQYVQIPTSKEIISLHNKVIGLEKQQSEPLEKRNLRKLENFLNSTSLENLVLPYNIKTPTFPQHNQKEKTYKDLFYTIRDLIEDHQKSFLSFGGGS